MEIKTGASVTKKWVVSYDMTAKAIKEGAAEVFSTPCMVSLMEDSCCDAIAQFLDEGYISVGISVNIRHLRPTPVGREISVTGTIKEVKGNKVLLEVVCEDAYGLIGTGTHGRCVVHHDTFIAGIPKA